MSELDDKEKNLDKQGDKEKDPKSAGTEKPGDGSQEPGPIPYDRFKEVNDRAKQLADQIQELQKKDTDREDELEKQRQDKLKEQEKFQELATEWEGKYSDLEPQHADAQKEILAMRELLGKYADAQMDSVPELFRDIVETMPLLDRLEWLTTNKDKLVTKGPKGIPPTPKGSHSGDMTDDERRKRSARTF